MHHVSDGVRNNINIIYFEVEGGYCEKNRLIILVRNTNDQIICTYIFPPIHADNKN